MVSNFQDPVLINVSVCFSSWIVWGFIWNPQQLPAAHRQPVPGGTCHLFCKNPHSFCVAEPHRRKIFRAELEENRCTADS